MALLLSVRRITYGTGTDKVVLVHCFLSEWPRLGHPKEECNIDYRLIDEKYRMKKLKSKGGENIWVQ
jgi:hypothetical protein